MKLLINDTISISPQFATEWLNWVHSVVIPLIKREPGIDSYRLTKIQGNEDENGITYAIQFICSDEDAYAGFMDNFDSKFQQEQLNRFRGQFGSFRSVLEIIDEG